MSPTRTISNAAGSDGVPIPGQSRPDGFYSPIQTPSIEPGIYGKELTELFVSMGNMENESCSGQVSDAKTYESQISSVNLTDITANPHGCGEGTQVGTSVRAIEKMMDKAASQSANFTTSPTSNGTRPWCQSVPNSRLTDYWAILLEPGRNSANCSAVRSWWEGAREPYGLVDVSAPPTVEGSSGASLVPPSLASWALPVAAALLGRKVWR